MALILFFRPNFLYCIFILSLLIHTNSIASPITKNTILVSNKKYLTDRSTSLPSTENIQNKKSNSELTAFEQIKKLRMNGDLDSAKSLAIKHLQNHPDDVDVMLLLGLINYQKSDYVQAEVWFQKVLSKSPTYLDAKLGLIRTKIVQKQYREASELIKQAIKQAPDNPDLKEIQILYKKSTEAQKKENE